MTAAMMMITFAIGLDSDAYSLMRVYILDRLRAAKSVVLHQLWQADDRINNVGFRCATC